jgi:ketosteroid isomerase-like protein
MQVRETSDSATQAALAIVDIWAKALARSDVETIVGLYAPDATFIGTSSKAVVAERRAFAPISITQCAASDRPMSRSSLRKRPRRTTGRPS